MESKKTRLKTGGRKRGSVNKATRTIREAAQEYTDDALKVLAEVMNDHDQPALARIAAASQILDRGHGRPTQSVEVDASVNNRRMDLSLIDAELAKAAEERARRQKELEESGVLGKFET
ncbi:MAG: hypothetical protein PHE17_09000 [Thiothrix sp.]|uniref:hypothetical protein n=1 Tax=Thiothrix sp. TaxID=1032 RepID=UPI00261E1D3A|nr:hypothetical protein [Thiothrix sp.]MDD5393141.1 hypothetical protein [Thiothrix sp.]